MKKIAKKLKKKPEIVAKVATKKKLPLSTVELTVDTIFEEIEKALLKGRKVELRGFGTFGVKKYESYKGKNPKTLEEIFVPAKRRPWFKPGLFRESLKK